MAIKGVNDLVEAAKSRIENLDVDDVVAELDAGATIVDIRDIRERIQLGAIPGSIHAPRGMLEFWAAPDSEYYRDMWVEDGRYVLYCAKGSRSALAADVLREMGFTNVAHLDTGFTGWVEAGREVADVASSSKWGRLDR
jgi:rhodanese-related sulfurtransferase